MDGVRKLLEDGMVAKDGLGVVSICESLLGEALKDGVADTRFLFMIKMSAIHQHRGNAHSRILGTVQQVCCSVAYFHEAGLDQEIPDATRLVHVNLDQITRLAPP